MVNLSTCLKITHFIVILVQRSEALQVALAKRLNTQDEMPAPFKRQSLMRRKPVENGTQPQLLRGTLMYMNCRLNRCKRWRLFTI